MLYLYLKNVLVLYVLIIHPPTGPMALHPPQFG